MLATFVCSRWRPVKANHAIQSDCHLPASTQTPTATHFTLAIMQHQDTLPWPPSSSCTAFLTCVNPVHQNRAYML